MCQIIIFFCSSLQSAIIARWLSLSLVASQKDSAITPRIVSLFHHHACRLLAILINDIYPNRCHFGRSLIYPLFCVSLSLPTCLPSRQILWLPIHQLSSHLLLLLDNQPASQPVRLRANQTKDRVEFFLSSISHPLGSCLSIRGIPSYANPAPIALFACLFPSHHMKTRLDYLLLMSLEFILLLAVSLAASCLPASVTNWY